MGHISRIEGLIQSGWYYVGSLETAILIDDDFLDD